MRKHVLTLTTRLNNFLKKTLNHSLIRFFLVSGLNTIFGYGIFAILLYTGLVYEIALLISTICGVIFNFKTIGSLVFGNKSFYLIFKFVFVYGIVYFFNVIGIKILKSYSMNVYLSAAILILPMALLAFTLNKNFVFNQKKSNE